MVLLFQECAINKIESRIQSEEVDKQEDSSEWLKGLLTT